MHRVALEDGVWTVYYQVGDRVYDLNEGGHICLCLKDIMCFINELYRAGAFDEEERAELRQQAQHIADLGGGPCTARVCQT